MRLVFDIETDGYLEELTKVHSLVIFNIDTQELLSYANQSGYQPISEGLRVLEEATELIGHNILGFDLPALARLGLYSPSTDVKITDTLVLSRLIYAHMEQVDWQVRFADMPMKLYGRHSLESWGYRLKFKKDDFGKQTDWKEWTESMQLYCEQDVRLNVKVYDKLQEQQYSQQAIELEHKFAKLLEKQMDKGVPFNEPKAQVLLKEIKPKAAKLKQELSEAVKPFVSYTTFIPKRDNRTLGYKKGEPIAKRSEIKFNPGSRPQIVRFLRRDYRWTPVDFTEKGNPKVDRDVLGKLTDWKEVPLILDYLDMAKLIGMLDTGKQSWLNNLKEGKLHGRIIHNGAVTGRCTHFNPNLAQIPAVRSYKGRECRELFYAPDGYKFVGCDAKGLELRMLGHYLHRYDGGTFANEVVSGDIHTYNQQAAGLEDRDDAKVFVYAYNYGAGDAKLGSIVEPQASESRQQLIGKELRARFELRLPALKSLVRDVKQRVKSVKYLKGLDGRLLYPRGQHMALNTLLQGAGAVVMKLAAVLLDEWVSEEGLDAYQALHIHDEFQYIVREDQADRVAELSCQAIREAGEVLKLKVVLEGESKIGLNWAETH